MKNEKGFTLIETIVALTLLGIIAVPFLGALVTASHAIIITNEQAVAESLARSQMEFLKNQDYITATDYNPGVPESGEVIYEKITGIPEGYAICSVDRDGYVIDNTVYGIPWDSQTGLPATTDAGLQRIRLIIKHYDKEIITLEDYKVNR